MRKEPVSSDPQLWQVGPGGMVASQRVIAVGRWDSAPIRRAVKKARAEGRLIDLTYGYACHWVLFFDSGHLALASEAAAPAAAEAHELREIEHEQPQLEGSYDHAKRNV